MANDIAPQAAELKTFEIPSENLQDFIKDFNRLVAKAKKLGVEVPSYNVLKTWTRPAVIDKRTKRIAKPSCEFNTITVAGVAPKLPGYRFLAVLEHAEEGTLIHRVPGTDDVLIRKDLREGIPVCEHCHTKRRRSETFVVEFEDTHEQISVGRQCLADFLGGKSPEQIARWAEVISTFIERDYSEREAHGTPTWPLAEFLGWVVKDVQESGWLSRTEARERNCGGGATADFAFQALIATGKEREEFGKLTEEERQAGADLLAWIDQYLDTLPESEFEKSEYLYNVRLIVDASDVRYKTSGLAASIIRIKEKALKEEVKRKLLAKRRGDSQYLGEVNQRMVFPKLQVENVIDIEGDFSFTFLHLFVDEQGNSLKWFSSSRRLAIGSQYKVKGTVKKHEEYKGIKTTVLTRCVCEML